MRSIRLALIGSAIVAALVTAGCDSNNKSESPGSSAVGTSQSPAPSASSGGEGDSKAACTAITNDIDTAMKNVADSEKIGPPAGHSAVSAQYSAGAAALYVSTIDASPAVSDAGKQVATAMSDLADKWATNPKEAPSKAALDTAVKQLKTACGTS